MPIPSNRWFIRGAHAAPREDHAWEDYPFSADSDESYFLRLTESWRGYGAGNAFALAVAPYLKPSHLGIPRASVQLFTEEALEVLDEIHRARVVDARPWPYDLVWRLDAMQILGRTERIRPFRIDAAPTPVSDGVWADGNVRFLDDPAVWDALKSIDRAAVSGYKYTVDQLHAGTTIVFQCDNRAPGLLHATEAVTEGKR